MTSACRPRSATCALNLAFVTHILPRLDRSTIVLYLTLLRLKKERTPEPTVQSVLDVTGLAWEAFERAAQECEKHQLAIFQGLRDETFHFECLDIEYAEEDPDGIVIYDGESKPIRARRGLAQKKRTADDWKALDRAIIEVCFPDVPYEDLQRSLIRKKINDLGDGVTPEKIRNVLRFAKAKWNGTKVSLFMLPQHYMNAQAWTNGETIQVPTPTTEWRQSEWDTLMAMKPGDGYYVDTATMAWKPIPSQANGNGHADTPGAVVSEYEEIP